MDFDVLSVNVTVEFVLPEAVIGIKVEDELGVVGLSHD